MPISMGSRAMAFIGENGRLFARLQLIYKFKVKISTVYIVDFLQ